MTTYEHPLRAAVLAEVHARPFAAVEAGTRILHLGYVTQNGSNPLAELAQWCAQEGFAPPPPHVKHHSASHASGEMSWEQHTEFVTLTLRFRQSEAPFADISARVQRLQDSPPSSGLLLVAVDLHLVEEKYGTYAAKQTRDAIPVFDETSLVISQVNGGVAMIMTDLKPNAEGYVRWLVVDNNMSPRRAGALVQRLLEIETYRIFALLGLPEAQRVSPSLREIEQVLAGIGREMTQSEGLEANHRLLDRLTGLAATLEADAAQSAYRFGASRAYHEIVRQRLAIISETPLNDGTTIAAFLDRRMAPAMRTCENTAERQADLSRKLTRAANLLRTRVDVELERQNRDLLSTMNDRTRLQLRLQQTVEGLSVAAISSYVVGLFGYLAKGAKDVGLLPVDPGLLTGLFVPVAILAVWAAVRRIRHSHKDETE